MENRRIAMPATFYWADWFENLRVKEGFRLMPRAEALIRNISRSQVIDNEDFELLFNMVTIGGDHQGEIYIVENDEFEQWWLVGR